MASWMILITEEKEILDNPRHIFEVIPISKEAAYAF